jgi:selenocysteine-specific elongation factor
VPSAGFSPLTLGTAGHIDHGKTVLVEALTGVNTDRLPEERARGISIELGFASLELPSSRVISIVDVPGHERFVRTMVAGSTGIDLFLLVIAADDGVMPQTREHLAVLEILEVPAGVVALTKTDLVGPQEVELAVADVQETLAGGRYEETEIVSVSAPAGKGLQALLAELDQLAAGRAPRAGKEGEPRLHVDRSFSLKGIGTVVTGTLWSGSLQVGEEVSIQPSGRTARVRSIEVHGGQRERADAGQRVAVNLAGVDRREVERGDLLATPDSSLRPTHLLDAAVELMPGARALRRGARVHLHHGTRASAARVAPIGGDLLEPGERAYVQLRLERPIVPAPGDRFVIRQVAPPDTIGGGVVIDPAPRRHGPGDEHVERLRLAESGDPLERLAARLATSPSGLDGEDAEPQLLEQLQTAGRASVAGSKRRRYFAPAQLEQARERLLTALAELGSGRPLSRGALADATGLDDLAASAVLEELIAAGRAVAAGTGFHAAEVARVEEPRIERLLDTLRRDALEPRSPEMVGAELGVSSQEARELLERAAVAGRLERLTPGLYYHPDALLEAERAVIALCERDGSVTIAGLRDELGTSRKYAQALLEHFDTRRLTRRQGDEHVLRRGPAERA